ncbi:probable 31-O-demethyl-FK506 methyltransferase FkbM [Coccomyxa sp. Obi]|nr:probable 31-O-demethyl-FK506 methyltransferase FkbM [Coccomyxa sp. Obi]
MQTMLHQGDATVTIINKGVGDGARETVEFTFYPAAAGWSTMYPDATEVSDAMDIFLERSLPTLEGMDPSLTNRVASLAARIVPNWLFENLSSLAVNRMLAHKKHFCCPLTTVSAIIKTEGLRCVDLLKIDVERAELDVLRGIADEDWHKIRQLVMEVHDDKNTLSAVRELLNEKGSFAKCVVKQDSQLEGSTLYNLYALQD